MTGFAATHQLFDRVAAERPSAIAVEAPDGELTFAELDGRSRALAADLCDRGVGAEDVVAVKCARSTWLIVAMLGVWRAGAAFLLLDPTEPEARIAEKLALAEAKTVIGDDWPFDPTRSVSEQVHPRQLAYVVFTSGSTGSPKGVLIEHLGLAEHVLTQLVPVYRKVAADGTLRVGGGAPVTFDSFIDQVLPTIALGHRLVLFDEMERRDPGSFLMGNLDVVDCSPSQLALLVEFGLLDEPLELLVFGGEKPGAELWKALRASATTAISIYGATECSIGSVEAEVHETERVCLGHPAGSATAYVLGLDLLQVRHGESGEIYLGGPGVGRGYLGDARQTARSFLPDPFAEEPGARMYRTGDLGRIGEDGRLEFLGRADDQLKISGYRIEPGEVETVLDGLAEVRRSAVVPAGAGGRMSHLIAYVEAADGFDADAVRAQLAARLPGYLVPRRIVPIDTIPLTHNGKTDRKQLAAMNGERR